MATTALHAESVQAKPQALPKLGNLADASADLDTSRVFAEAAERLLHDMRDWVRMYKRPEMQDMLNRINDCESLVIEARCKASAARQAVNVYSDAAHSLGNGKGKVDEFAEAVI